MRMEIMAGEPGGEDWMRRRRARSLAIALGLGVLVIIFYAATIIRLGPNALRKETIPSPGASKAVETDAPACKRAGAC
jgi:hypothetical protein